MARKVSRMDNKYSKDKRIRLKMNRVVKKRVMIFGGLLSAILIVLVCVMLWQMKSNHDLKVAYQKENQKLADLKDQEIALKEKLKQLNSKEYITKIARSEYFLSNDGEIIFKIPEEDKKQGK